MTKETKTKLKNIKHELFCNYYANSGETFGNAVRSYILAYGKKVPTDILYRYLDDKEKRAYNVASVEAMRLLEKPNIKERCNEIIDSTIKNEVVDRELQKVVLQEGQLVPKIMAIKEYNAVKNRVTKQFDITSGGEPFTNEQKQAGEKAIGELLKKDS